MSATARHTYQVEVREVVQETTDAVSLTLHAVTGPTDSLDYRPGQFLTLRVPHPDGSLTRCYSLSSAPNSAMRPTITVKRVHDGRASNWICDNVAPGTVFDALAPTGTFVPRDWSAPFLLVAAGSGITPIMSILRTALAAHDNPITVAYANRDAESIIFTRELDLLAHCHRGRLTVTHWLESESGRPTEAALRTWLTAAPESHAYLCGPAPFMTAARNALDALGLDASHIHSEVFTSLTTDAFGTAPAPEIGGSTTASTATVELDDEVHSITWPADTVLLDVLLAQGLDAPYVCREGTCGGCAYTLRRGEVRMRENHTLDQHDLARGTRLACQSEPRSDTLDIVFDQ
ncbi:ferredoxin--NADP reductase [Nocardia mangyaensis]|uniref:ferredoxin--NADP reductase n=1 Tax=Nocardia mangyaensis TaxID=2213200 RepID=UPI00267704C8|nr:ferredoxin--NADP reductase [Nocardia mangyaensis]MDO3646274.1 ferredoxin--NADP reductase [Nocardia mangyaensis]